MPTIKTPDTESSVGVPSVSLAQRDTQGGFLGGLVQGALKEAPAVMEARKKRMQLLAEGNEDASYQAATMDAEKIIREIGEKISSGELTAKRGKVEASFALQKVSRESGLTIKAANSLRDTFSTIISVYGEEDSVKAGEPNIILPAYGGPARVIGAKDYDPEVTAQVQIKSFPTQVQAYFYQLMARDPEAAKDEVGRYAQHLKGLQDNEDAASIADARMKLNKASQEDQSGTAKQNLFQAQDKVVGLFYSIMAKARQDASGNISPQVALSEASMKIDSLILQNPNLLRLAESANVPISQFVDSVLGNWKDRMATAVTGVDPLLEKTRSTTELEAQMKFDDVTQMMGIPPKQRMELNNSTKFLDAAILKKMQTGTLGVDMPKSLNEFKLEVRAKISHGNEVNRRVSAYTTPTPDGLHKLVASSVPDFINLGKALGGDAAAVEEVSLMDIDATKRNLEVIIKDPNFKQLDPENQTQLQRLHEQVNEIYKRM